MLRKKCDTMKKLSGVVLALCAACLLAGCGEKVDTSAWKYYSFTEPGVALLLPEDLMRDPTPDALFSVRGDELRLEIDACDELYEDLAALASEAGGDREAEVVTANGAELVRLAPDGDGRGAEFCTIGPDGDAYRIRLAANEAVKDRRAAALLAAVAESICPCADVPAGTRISMTTAQPPPDCLVLVNKRHALPEGWEAALDLAVTVNGRGERLAVERGVCKAYFGLKKALAAEGVAVDLDAAYGGEGEHRTGLALDLAPQPPDAWAKTCEKLAGFGFILRYPEDGAYYTGCAYEPRHIRYVGTDAAREIAARGVTLEEYLGTLPAAIDYLVLVNAKNALPDDWEDAVEIVYMTNRHGEEIGVERITYDAYCRLRDALAEEGVHLDINSAYRSVAAQEALAQSYLKKYGADYVKAYVALPGYSEHHTGLAVDLYLESMDVWAKIHARLAEFGFILRYPEGKESVTGYGYEPWHVRYVGTDTAREITGRGITLEEYLDAA